MTCEHKTFRCTNGIFFCLTCGAEIPNPYEAAKEPEGKPAKKKGGKGK